MKATLGFPIVLVALIFSCQSADKEEKTTKTLTLNRNEIDSVMNQLNFCDSFSVEFFGLYPILDTLPTAANDTLYIDQFLKLKGFKSTNSGSGNWGNGPRLFDLELSKGDCHCHVYKKYFNNRKHSDGSFDLKVSEKMVCNSVINAVE